MLEGLLDRLPRCSVKVAEYFGEFQQLASLHHLIELLAVDEMVVPSVDLARTPCPRRHRNRQRNIAFFGQQHARQRGLAGARRRRQHQHHAAPGDRLAFGTARHRHSRFCTCSRNCSTTALSSSPMLVSSTSFALAHKVFDSRLSSCDRKSSLRPTGPPSAEQLAGLRHVGGEAVKLLADVGLGREQDRLLVQAVGIEPLRCFEQGRDLLGEPRLDRLGLAAGRRFRARRQFGDLTEPLRQHMAERRAFGAAHLLEAFQRLHKARDDRGFGGLSLALLFLGLDHIHHTFERKDAVEGWRRGFGFAIEVLEGRQHGREHRLVDPRHRRDALAAYRQVCKYRAARQRLRGGVAHRHFNGVPPGRQAELEIKPLGVDRFELPGPGIGAGNTVAPREAGHARQRHRVPTSPPSCPRIAVRRTASLRSPTSRASTSFAPQSKA